jgi:hypothetical protein
MLPQGGNRLSVAVTEYEGHASDTDGNDQSHGVDGFEIMGSHGVTDDFEIGGKLAYIDAEVNIYHLMVVPKLSIMPDQLAFTAPTGVMFVGDSDDTMEDNGGHLWETLPGLVGSHVINPSVELTGALQALWAIEDDFSDSQVYGGLNFGVRLRPPGQPWCVQPELGILIPITDRDDNFDYVLQYGIAFHYDFGGSAAAAGGAGTGGMMATPPPAPPP